MLKNKWLNLDIQYFADGGTGAGADGEDPGTGSNPDKGDGKETDPVTLTPEELQKKIEAESDRKLASALEKKQKEWEAQQQKAIDDAIAEKERLSKLSEKERKDEELNQREQDIAQRLADLEQKELKADAISDLNEKGLPADFAVFLLADNAENTLKNINAFKEAFDNAITEAVKEKLRQDTPPAGGGVNFKSANFGKQLAQMNKKNNENTQKAQFNYFKDGGN